MPRVTAGSIVMTWDPDSRLATLWFERETHATGEDAAVLIEALARWVSADDRSFALLGDGGMLRDVDAEYRARWARFFRQHRERSWIAFFNMKTLIRVAADMFRLGTGVRLKAFITEEEARAWLRRAGIHA